MSLKTLAYLVPVLALTSCGSSMPPFQGGSPGNGKDMSIHLGDGGGNVDLSSGDASSDAQMAVVDMAGFNCAGCPKVSITSPAPNTEVQYDTLTVTATITSGSSVIDGNSVTILITPPGGSVLTAPMTLTGMANVYSGSISIAAFPSGTMSFTVSAADAMGRKGSASESIVHDHGPVITFLQPSAPTAHGSVAVELMIDDPLHPVTDPTKVSAYIEKPGDVTLTQEMGASPLRMQGTINFSSFNPPLAGDQIINAQAVNSNGTVGQATKKFTVDNSGPVIEFIAPVAGGFYGGVVTIQAKITDISGVNDSTVLAVFGNDPSKNSVPLVRTDPKSDTFQGFFDLRSLGQNYVLPELSITAADNLGNSSQYGEEIVVDNTPPKMSMDSKIQMYLSFLNANTQLECSAPFSPLGPFTASPPEVAYDGAIMSQIIGLRARIEDHGNTAPGLLVERFSGIDQSTVYLFAIHDDGATALAVDTNGDGVCDNVNPTLVPSTSAMMQGQALSLKLSPLNTTGGMNGTADFRFVATPPGSWPARKGTCDVFGDTNTTKAPPPLCTQANTGLTVVIPWADTVSPIWSIPPVANTASQCVGYQLDSANTLPSGPTCVVTVATDKAGNTMVTAPLHICIDKTGDSASSSTDMAGSPCAGWNPNSPPTTCTGVWDKMQMKIVAGTCTPAPTFVNGEVRDYQAFQ